jgi:hydroxyacylglutathione hydrolase
MVRDGALLLDTRPAAQFGAGHVPGSLHIGLSGQFASWAGSLIPIDRAIVLVAEDAERVAEARTRLARVGLENVVGYLEGGILAWDRAGRALARTEQIGVDELHERIRERADLAVLDVRRPGEWQGGHIPGARHLPLDKLPALAETLTKNQPLAVICAGGFRSSIATSLLQQRGFDRITNVIGGMGAWKAGGFETVAQDAVAS